MRVSIEAENRPLRAFIFGRNKTPINSQNDYIEGGFDYLGGEGGI